MMNVLLDMLPSRVNIFRLGDGVSEGEYNTVAIAELEAIQGKFELTIVILLHLVTYCTFSCRYQDYRWRPCSGL